MSQFEPCGNWLGVPLLFVSRVSPYTSSDCNGFFTLTLPFLTVWLGRGVSFNQFNCPLRWLSRDGDNLIIIRAGSSEGYEVFYVSTAPFGLRGLLLREFFDTASRLCGA